MDLPSWTEIIGLLTISLGWAGVLPKNLGGPQAPEAETQEAQEPTREDPGS